MAALPQQDLLTDLVLDQMPSDVRASFNLEQLDAIREATARLSPRTRHAVDLRFVVPLFFAQFYVVLLAGKDRRNRTQETLIERRSQAGAAATVWGYVGLLAALVLVGLGVAYLLKSAAGIDIFPWHLHDVLPSWLMR